jgi:hypothetical protein
VLENLSSTTAPPNKAWVAAALGYPFAQPDLDRELARAGSSEKAAVMVDIKEYGLALSSSSEWKGGENAVGLDRRRANASKSVGLTSSTRPSLDGHAADRGELGSHLTSCRCARKREVSEQHRNDRFGYWGLRKCLKGHATQGPNSDRGCFLLPHDSRGIFVTKFVTTTYGLARDSGLGS